MRLELLKVPGLDSEANIKKVWTEKSKFNIFFLPAVISGFALGVLLAFSLKNIVAGLVAGLTVYEVIMSFGDAWLRQKQDKLDDQIEVFLVELGSVTGKLPFLPGIKAVLENTPQPLKGVISNLVLNYEMGLPVDIEAENKDLRMLVELIRLKELFGGDITGSLTRLAEKAKATRDLRAELKISMKGGQAALVAQYGVIAFIMLLTMRQAMFQQVLVDTFGGKIIMVVVFVILLASAFYSRKAVKY